MEKLKREIMENYEIIIDQYLIDKEDEEATLSFVRKTYKSTMIPTVGMMIEESVWGESKLIKKIIINYKETSCLLAVENVKIAKKDLEETIKMYKGHGWKDTAELLKGF